MSDSDNSSINEQQLIDQFKEVCQVDDEVAKEFLERNLWDVESSVQEFFQGSEFGAYQPNNNSRVLQSIDRPGGLHRRYPVPNRPSTSRDLSFLSRTRTVYPVQQRKSPPRVTWSTWFSNLIKLPFAFVYHAVFDILFYVLELFRPPVLAVTDPQGDVRNFINEFTEKYGQENSLRFFNGSYDDAVAHCKTNLLHLLIYLHNPTNRLAGQFVRDVLLNEAMRSFLKENPVLLWGVSVQSPEGRRMQNLVRDTSYPVLILCSLRDNQMTQIIKLVGGVELSSIITSLQQAVYHSNHFLNILVDERQERESFVRIRQEQEKEYQEGLVKDRARLMEKRRLEIEKEKERKLQEEGEKMEEERKERFLNKKTSIALNIPEEPNDEACVRVTVHFPSGKRFERKFKEDDSLELLFDAVLINENCPENFSLISSYPRSVLNCAPEWYREHGDVEDTGNIRTFRENGLFGSILVLVRDNKA